MRNSTALRKGMLTRDEQFCPATLGFTQYIPSAIGRLENPQTAIPRIAKDGTLVRLIEGAVQQIPTSHKVCLGDARTVADFLPESIHLVVTSPPYWTLKQYRQGLGQMGHISDYEEFLVELDKIWERCYRALVPGGRIVCVVGDVCLSRRRNAGRHTVVPLHAQSV
jgi:modification methylase